MNAQDLALLKQLSPEEKRRLAARMLRERSGEAAAPYPLSHNQRALWVLHRLAPQSSAYHVSFPLRLRSRVDVEALRRACQALIARHPLLRSRFFERDGEPLQAPVPEARVSFEQVEARRSAPDAWRSLLDTLYRRPLELEKGVVARFFLVSLDEQDHVLLPVVHHIAIDGHSILLVLEELGRLYAEQTTGQPALLPLLAHGYEDFVQAQRQLLAGPEGERLWSYWKEQLRGELPVLELHPDKPRPPVRGERGRTLRVSLDRELTQGLKDFARQRGVTLFTLMLAAYQVLLHRYTGQGELLIGCPDGSRPGAEYGRIVGYFVNPVPIRGDLSGDPSFEEFLRRLSRTVQGAFSHRELPFAVLNERLQTKRDPSRTPIFQACFNFLQLLGQRELESLIAPAQGRAVTASWGGLRAEPLEIDQQEGQFDLVLDLFEAHGSLSGTLKFNTDVYETASLERLRGHYERLLRELLSAP